MFNLVEILCVYLSGLLFRLSNTTIFIIMFVFVLARMTFGKTLHYKSPYKCFIATLTIFLSLFVVCKVNIYLSKVSKYQDIMDFVKYNPEKMVDFEDRLEKQDNLDYLIYKYRFKENLTFDKISKLLDIDSPRISEKQDKIALAIRMTFKI